MGMPTVLTGWLLEGGFCSFSWLFFVFFAFFSDLPPWSAAEPA